MSIPILGQKPVVGRYDWEPLEDITAYELAKCLPSLFMGLVQHPKVFDVIEGLDFRFQRHFKAVFVDEGPTLEIARPIAGGLES